jgi:hypothetical protein
MLSEWMGWGLFDRYCGRDDVHWVITYSLSKCNVVCNHVLSRQAIQTAFDSAIRATIPLNGIGLAPGKDLFS